MTSARVYGGGREMLRIGFTGGGRLLVVIVVLVVMSIGLGRRQAESE